MSGAYREALRRLRALDDDAADLRAEAHRWYADRDAAAVRAEQAADEEVAQAARAAEKARRDLHETEAEAARLWSDFVHRYGPSAERYGRTVPEPVVPRQRGGHPGGGRPADEYLRDVSAQVTFTRPDRPLTNSVQLLFGLLGAAGGALGSLLGHLLRAAGRSAGGDWAAGMPVLALLLTFVGPVAAAGIGKQIADRRGAPLDAAAVGLILGAGLTVIAVVYAITR